MHDCSLLFSQQQNFEPIPQATEGVLDKKPRADDIEINPIAESNPNERYQDSTKYAPVAKETKIEEKLEKQSSIAGLQRETISLSLPVKGEFQISI